MSDPGLQAEFSALKRFARRGQDVAQAELESCDFCSEPIPAEHRHLLEVSTREVMCVCQACSILFDRQAASQIAGASPDTPLQHGNDRNRTQLNRSQERRQWVVV